MQEIYIKLSVVVVSSAVFLYIMNRSQKEKIRQAQLEFERMMKSRGLSLEIEDDKKESK